METLHATIVYLHSAEQTLMLHRNKDREDFLYGKWNAPGGKLKEGEDKEQCARREFKEETGLELLGNLTYRGKVLFDNERRTFQGKRAKYHFLVHIFEAHAYRGALQHPREGTLHWIADEAMAELQMEHGDYWILEQLRKLGTLSERIVHVGEKFESATPLSSA